MESRTIKGRDLTHAVHRSIQAFLYQVKKEDKASGRQIQAFSGSTDLPQLTKDVFNVTHQVNEFDLNWQRAFKGVPLEQGQLNWEITTVDSGLTFKEIPEGGKLEYKGIGGEKVTVDVLKYGAGLGLTWETIEGRKLYKFIDTMNDARSKLFNLWANVHYGLLAAASLVGAGQQIAWQGVATDTILSRDIATINKGAEDLGEVNKDKGFGDTANMPFLLYARPTLRSRINNALRVTSAEVNTGREPGASGTSSVIGTVTANVEPLYTFNASVLANKGLLVLPGNKIQNAAYMQERQLSREEQESLNKLIAVWTAFGATVADTDQVFELSFA
jgi:hypothetical protein